MGLFKAKSFLSVAQNDSDLYELLVIVDTLRLGRAREKEIAANELAKRLSSYAENQQ